MAERNDEPGYFVVIDAEGAEIRDSRRPVPAGRDHARDERIIHMLRAAMGPGCHVVFKPETGTSSHRATENRRTGTAGSA